MDAFFVGTIVQLKSGGPLMTVASISTTGALCVWFGNSEDPKTANFPIETLAIA